jgi:hypothetical protein
MEPRFIKLLSPNIKYSGSFAIIILGLTRKAKSAR